MKVLLMSDFYPPHPGGLERAVADLSAELAARGHGVTVATLWHEGLPRRGDDGPIRVYRLEGSVSRLPFLFTDPYQRFHPPVPDPLLTRQLRRLIATERPDVVHGHTWMLLSALPLRRAYSFAAVATLHDYALLCPKKTLLYQEERPCSHGLSRRCLTCAPRAYGAAKGLVTTAGFAGGRNGYRAVDAFIAISTYVAAMHARDGLVREAKLRTIPNFVRDAFALASRRPRLADVPDDYILFVGALGRHKGLHALLAAYTALGTDIPLVLIGPRRQDTPAELPPGVVVRPAMPHDDIVAALDHCRFLVSPSLWPEPFGLVAVEAMARGKAVVASRLGGTLDVVQDESTGLLVPPGDSAALAGALRRLLDDSALSVRLGQAGAARFAAHFSADAVVPRIIDTYKAAVRRRRAELR